MDAVALISVISSGTVGVLGVGSALWTSKEERRLRRQESSADREAASAEASNARDHERRLARDARVWEDKRESYVEQLKHLLVLMDSVESTYPQITVRRYGEDPKDEVSEEAPPPEEMKQRQTKLTEMEAGAMAFGSPEVIDLMQQFMQKARLFSFEVGAYRTFKDQGAPAVGTGEAYKQLQATRQELRDLYKQISEQMRAELTEP